MIEGRPQRDPLVELILGQPGMVAKLLQQHQPDGVGHCSPCSLHGNAAQRWPCSTYAAARRAEQAGAQ